VSTLQQLHLTMTLVRYGEDFYKINPMVLLSFQAKEALAEAEQQDPTNIFTQYYIFKIAILDGEAYRGINVLYSLTLTKKSLENKKNPQ